MERLLLTVPKPPEILGIAEYSVRKAISEPLAELGGVAFETRPFETPGGIQSKRVAMLIAAGRDTPDLAHRAWRFCPNEAAGQPYFSARICRPLADYGEDLQLIARVPDVAPAELSSVVPSV